MCQIVCQIVACASMRIVVSQVCGLLSVAYSASFWLRATMRRHTYSAVQPVPSMCCFSTYLLSAFVEYASCLQLYTMCLIEEYARKSYNKPNYKAHSFAVRRMRRRCRRCGLMCVCVCHLPTRAPQNTSPWWRKPRRQRVGGGRFAKAWEAMRCRGGTRRRSPPPPSPCRPPWTQARSKMLAWGLRRAKLLWVDHHDPGMQPA